MNFLKKLANKEVLLYIVFGILTTAINIVLSYILIELLCINTALVNVLAWSASVVFAYVTNLIFVFDGQRHLKALIKSFLLFVAARLFSLFIDVLGMFLFYDLLSINFWIVKVSLNIIVIILNYIFSKVLIFKKKH